jgi:hypothetical protein
MHFLSLARASLLAALIIGGQKGCLQMYSEDSPMAVPGPQQGANLTPGELRLLYTGKLLGYFRIPDWQSPDSTVACANNGTESKAAKDFVKVLDAVAADIPDKTLTGAILLGTGDNFSPEIEAREFCFPPENRVEISRGYTRTGKEFFLWNEDTQKWVTYEDFGHQSSVFQAAVSSGREIIPSDNVARFFTTMGYAAIVPGRHDFYFGPDRLRLLARRLATDPITDAKTLHREGYGTQMLGANLVIETTWKSDHTPLSDKDNPPRFIPRFPTLRELGLSDALHMQVKNFPSGGNVYPWYVGLSIDFSNVEGIQSWPSSLAQAETKIADLRTALTNLHIAVPPDTQKLLDILENLKVNLCEASQDFDQSTHTPDILNCAPQAQVTIQQKEKNLTLQIMLPWKDNTKPYTLEPGHNYRLCLTPKVATVKDMDGGHTFCSRISVYQPYFQFPWGKTAEMCQHNPNCTYSDPDPYLVLERQDLQEKTQIVIYGVVDPKLLDNVGLLNYGWMNINKKYKTVVAAKDPGEAIKEMRAHYERRRKEQFKGLAPAKDSIQVLLADMTPQQAEVLATRMGHFRAVVAEADEQMSRSQEDITKTVILTSQPSAELLQTLLIPAPFFLPSTFTGTTDIGYLGIRPVPGRAEFEIRAFHKNEPSGLYIPDPPAGPDAANAMRLNRTFWQLINAKLNDKCMPEHRSGFPVSSDHADWDQQMQMLTLCLLQKRTGADVALLQKRDFFTYLPADFWTLQPDRRADYVADHQSVREIIDRIIWKGDFVNLIYVPGSALKKALDQSKAFDAEDSSSLSLSDERNRGFATLGVRFDAVRSEYIVNALPLDPNKLYAVATSDYVSAGDTGYPDLAASQVKPPSVPADFGRTLITLSSVVCRALETSEDRCLDDLSAAEFFDELIISPQDTREGKTAGKQLELWSFFHHPRSVPGSGKTNIPQERAEAMVEQRLLWDLNLNKLGLGLTRLNHTGDDFDVNTNFSGITSPGVNTLSSTTLTSDFQATLARNANRHQFFLSPAYTYNVQYKGQPDDFTQLNQIADLGSLDLGYIHPFGNRAPEHIDLTFTEHFETPLTSAFNAFTLPSTHTGPHGESIKDQLRFHVDRSYTLLTRPGLRWKRRISSIELGPEWGHEWNALTGINFATGSTLIPCPATAAQTIGQCFKNNISGMSLSTLPATTRNGQDHTGSYWKINLTIPFHPRVSYVLTDAGDWFFVRYGTETSTTTLLRDYSQHQLKFIIFPSFSIGPELDALLYRNKSVPSLKGHFLFQDQVIVKAQFNFDLFNRRDMKKQLSYAPPAKQ